MGRGGLVRQPVTVGQRARLGFECARAAPRSALALGQRGHGALAGRPCAGSPPRRFLRQALHDSTRSFSNDQEWRRHMGQQMGRHAPTRRIPWATPPVGREDEEIHTLSPRTSRASRVRASPLREMTVRATTPASDTRARI